MVLSAKIKRYCSVIKVIILFFVIYGCAHTHTLNGSSYRERPVRIEKFVISAGDELDISVWRHPDLCKVVKVSPIGDIFLPLIGKLRVENLSIEEVQNEIKKRLSEYLVDPKVTVSVKTYQAYKISVLGEVKRPSVFPMERPLRISEAISLAGGFTSYANKGSVLVIRGYGKSAKIIKVNFSNFISKGNPTEDIFLLPGDVVYVPMSSIGNIAKFCDYLHRILRPFVDLGIGIISWYRVTGED